MGCRIWDVDNWQLMCDLRDEEEKNIEEFYVVKFTPDSRFVICACCTERILLFCSENMPSLPAPPK